jgi:hypothetical protein
MVANLEIASLSFQVRNFQVRSNVVVKRLQVLRFAQDDNSFIFWDLVELVGIEPTTSSLRTTRSPS